MDRRDKRSTYSRLEDSDKSCVHAVTVIGAVFAVLAFITYPAGIFDVPCNQLTAGIVLRFIAAVILAIVAVLICIDVIKVFIKR